MTLANAELNRRSALLDSQRRVPALSQQKEAHLRLVIDTIPTMAWSLLPDGALDFVNQRWLEYTGLSLQEALADSRRIVHAKDLPTAVEEWTACMAAGQACEHEMRLRRADGEYRCFLVRVVPLRNAQGNIVKWYGTSTDIEDRKRAEEARRDSEDHLRLVINTIPTTAWTTQPDGAVDFVNQRYLEYTGLSSEDALQDAIHTVHPEDLPSIMEKWSADMAAGEPYEGEMRLRRADGEYRWFLNRTVPLRDEEGKIVKWYGTATDIEDRKQAEDALRESEGRFAAFMDNLPSYAWMKDLQGRYVYVNHMVRGLPGYQSLGKTDAQISPAGLAAEYRANDQQVIATKKPLHTVERYLHEGKQRYMVGSKFPIFDKTGAIALVGGVGVDITERIEAEDALRESEEKFRQLAENIREVFWMTTLHLDEVLYVSPAYESVWGRSLESLRQRPQSFMDAIHTEDRERVIGILEGQRQQGFEVEYRIVRPDGSVRWIRDRGFPVKDASGKVYRIAGVAEDITERKRVEMALQKNEQLLSETQVLARTGSWEHNLVTGEIANTEGNLRIFFGDDHSKGARFEDFAGVVHRDDREYVSARHTQLLAEGGPRDIEYRVVWPDGTVHVLFGRATVVRDAAGRPLRVYGTNVDITERKRAENALRDSGVQLQALSRRLVELQESERRQLSRELHDRVGQNLTALKINLDILQ